MIRISPYADAEPYVTKEARLLKLQLAASNTPIENDELPVPVIDIPASRVD